VPDKPVAVHFSLDAMARMRPLGAIHAERPRTEESGGLLLGRIKQSPEGGYMVAVDDFEPLDCEHVRGASWILSKTDKDNLDRKLRKWATRSRREVGVVGWYRTHTRPGLFLDQHDFEVFQEFFGHPGSIALLIRPSVDEPAQASFFFWEEDDIYRSTAYLPFEFRPEAHGRDVATAEEEVVEIAPTPKAVVRMPSSILRRKTPLPVAVERSARPDPGSRWYGKQALLWVAVAAGLGAGIFWQPRVLSPVKQSRQSSETAGGAVTRERPVFSAPADAVSPPAAEAVQDPPAEVLAAEQTRGRKEAKRTLKKFSPELGTGARPVPTLQEAPPPMTASIPTEPLAALSRVPEIPQATVTVEPVRNSALRRAVGSIPGFGFLKGKKADQAFVHAKAVRQIRPVPPGPVKGAVPVRVKLTIAKTGEVVDAELVNRHVDPVLARSAIEAARKWEFEPARVDDKPVEDQVIVQFRFGSGGDGAL
jgi:protein TonB